MIELPAVDTPRVSVLMVTFGACEWVRRSLQALVENTPPVYELIIVDNGSTDGTLGLLRNELRGARVHLSGENLGFGMGNNLAAAHARGEHLCFLNSDAIVPPGWLDPLVAAFDDPLVASVSPMLVYPDGTVQEAGAIVEPDGRVIALGRFSDPDSLDNALLGPITFASAACLLVRRSAFERVGGFDPLYGTAYYEDVDLMFELQSLGLRLVVDPSIRVVHAQGASSPSSDTAAERIRSNQERFSERWARALHGRPVVFAAPEPHHAAAARDFDLCDRALVVCAGLPDPLAPGDSTASAVEALRDRLRDGRVTLASLDDTLSRSAAAAWLARGVEVVIGPDIEDWLQRHLFHYAAIMLGPGVAERAGGRLGEALREHQPQAVVSTLPVHPVERDALDRDLLSLGLVPRSV